MDKCVWLVPIFVVLSYILSILKKTKHPHIQSKVPPGSLGFPFLGETLQLYAQDPVVFFSTRQTRYGDIFKTRILGCPCIMLASPEAARLVLINQAHLFKPTFPTCKESLIGPWALFFHQGGYHTRLRRLVRSALSPETLRRLIVDIEALTVSALNSWADGQVIKTYNEMKRLSFDVGILVIFGHLEGQCKEELWKNYDMVNRGYNSLPTNVPGTPYYKALKARKRLDEILKTITRERKEKKLPDSNLLSRMLNSKDENGHGLSNDQIADNIIGLLFAAQDTTASAMTWVVKYLHDNPKILEAVTNEQMEIYRFNGNGSSHLTWHQTRNMPLTHKVIMETLRVASIISFTFREAATDVEYGGYIIPKGWKVMPLFRNIHHNTEFFHEPTKFDPTRFESPIRPNTFLPFGSGGHSCPGNEVARLEMLIFVHHLSTQFKCEVKSGNGIQYSPFAVPINGLVARFWRENTVH